VNSPKPALVTQAGARRLPRVPLLLLCAAYLLPGLIGRDPWRNADLTAFGLMVAMAEGRTSWWAPTLGGVPADTALLPHWLGAAFISLTNGLMPPEVAARLPFGLLLALTLALIWYTTLHLARTEAAQPVPFAFGGEAEPVDYARAIADGAVLALMATLGLLQLGHETTPELAQLCAVSLFLYALAAAPFRGWQARAALLAALPLLAGSGAPAVAVAMGLGGTLVCTRSRYDQVRAFAPWTLAATVAGAASAAMLDAWHWRALPLEFDDLPGIARQWLWFMWPVWPMALWTLWRWRRQLSYRHISVPAVTVIVALLTNLATYGSDRALMLGLPGLAVLAAFALPTLKRSAAAAIDWFSMFFFSAWALLFWVHYVAMHTGMPPRPAANILRLAPGFEPVFSAPELALAVAGTLAWLAVVRWRTGRHREAVWKSLVLPAGGVALCWLLAMTLLLPPLDYMRSPRLAVSRLMPHIPAGACVLSPGLTAPNVAALEHFGRWRVVAARDAIAQLRPDCNHLVLISRQNAAPAPAGWKLTAMARRPGEREEVAAVYRRSAASP
jgi:hypothetical protein